MPLLDCRFYTNQTAEATYYSQAPSGHSFRFAIAFAWPGIAASFGRSVHQNRSFQDLLHNPIALTRTPQAGDRLAQAEA